MCSTCILRNKMLNTNDGKLFHSLKCQKGNLKENAHVQMCKYVKKKKKVDVFSKKKFLKSNSIN